MLSVQVVRNQKHLARGILDLGLQKFNPFACVKCLIDDHPARLALIGNRGNPESLRPLLLLLVLLLNLEHPALRESPAWCEALSASMRQPEAEFG